jgi:N-acetylneuraminic acid mutarotase
VNANISFTTKTHLIRGAFYLFLLLAFCAIPFALAQSHGRGATKSSVIKPTLPKNLASINPTVSTLLPEGGCQFHVLIVYADTVGQPAQLRSQIQAEPNVISVDVFDATSGTPTLAQLQQYQIVVPLGSSPFLDSDTLGNNLADYVDGGGIVVQQGFSFDGPGQPFGINGRWVNGNYNPYYYSINVETNAFTLGPHNAAHPLMSGVTTLNSNLANIVTLASGATEVAQNSLGLGESLVAYRPVSGGHTTVGVTAYVGALAVQSGDWGKVIVNAGNWLNNCEGGTPSPTATASPTPTPTPTGTPGCTPRWLNRMPMANARRNPATVAVSAHQLYAITGFNAAPDYTTVNERFNGNSWTTEAPIPVPHAQSRGTAVGQIIYVPGGFNSVSFGGPLDSMQIYNTSTRTWSSGVTMPGTRGGVATATFGGMVYIIGGYTTPFPTATNTVFIYNPGTNSYATGAPMPGIQGNVAGVLLNGEIYVVGGGTAPGAQYTYNPATNTWRTIAVLPTTGGTCESDNGFVLNNELWVVGCVGLPINQQGWIYNPESDSWRTGPPYNVDQQGAGAALFRGFGFVVGGGAASGGSTTVELVGCGAAATPTPTCSICFTPTPTVGPTATATAPATATPTSTPTATATATSTSTPTPTPNLCSVIDSWPQCGSVVVGTAPTDFVIHLGDGVDTASLQGSDFMVNGTPANSVTVLSGGVQITFHFDTSPAVRGQNTMHIPAGAFFCSQGTVQEFTCTFAYQPSTPTPTPTPTFTPRPSPTPRFAPTPRVRPTPPPRP